jgi:molybdopterin converting factor small subunit
MAELKFLGYLADKAGGRNQEVHLEKPKRLRDLLPSSFPENDVIILINQKVGNLDSLIQNGDAVVLMPMISGG